MRSSVNPVVPTTALMPLSMRNFRLSITTLGWVKSTTTWVSLSVNAPSGSPASTPAVNVRSSAASIASTIVPPTLPFAPSTPTRMVFSLLLDHCGPALSSAHERLPDFAGAIRHCGSAALALSASHSSIRSSPSSSRRPVNAAIRSMRFRTVLRCRDSRCAAGSHAPLARSH